MLLYHPCHGSERAQCRYKEKDHWKYIGKFAHPFGVHGEFSVTLQRFSVENIPLPVFHPDRFEPGTENLRHHICDSRLRDQLLAPDVGSSFPKWFQMIDQVTDTAFIIPVCITIKRIEFIGSKVN